VVAADSGEAYPGATVRRAAALVDDIVLDFAEVSADSAHEWEWAFHARGKQETSVTNGVAVPIALPEIDVRLVEKDGTGKAVRDLAAKR
jgi:hypothetical protein